MSTKLLVECLGWYGTTAIITAYALNSFGVLQTGSSPYLLLNLSGSLGIVIVSLKKKDYQPAALNVVWLLIAVFVLARSFT